MFALSIFPFYIKIINAIARNLTGSDLSDSFLALADLPLGWIGLFALTVWGIIAFTIYYFYGDRVKAGSEYLMVALYAVAPAFLIAIGRLFQGYHAFIGITVLAIIILGLIMRRHINWFILIGLGSLSMIAFGFWQFVYGVIFGLVALVGLGLIFRDRAWKTAVILVLLGVIGYSAHLFIPIRSSQNPRIDENNPSESFNAFVNYLERKQYGAQSMTERMFERRAEWQSQFGDFRRMGFWRFFKEQYGFASGKFFLVFVLGLFGIWEMIRRRPQVGLPFLLIILFCSVGLVLYMNFADGTRQSPVTGLGYIEVRNRDYFFTPAFVFFGLAIGLGLAGIIDLIRDAFSETRPVLRHSVFGLSCLLGLTPLVPLTQNYFYSDRSRNYMPYDYARNYLTSCRKDGILITNGDNDTFPVWCIQEVYGFRTDVANVNLSLANTSWYIKQLRDKFDVPISWTDAQIEPLKPFRDQNGTAHRIQDQAMTHIIKTNQWQRPVHLSVTVPEESRRYGGTSLEDFLVLEGLVMTLTPGSTEGLQLNFERTRELFVDEFSYRGLNDPGIYKNESTRRLIGNYAQGFIVLSDSLRRAGDFAAALEYVHKGLAVLPKSFEIYAYGAQLLAEMGRLDTLQTYVENAPVGNKHKLYFNWAIAAKMADREEEALEVLELTHGLYPDYVDAFRALATMYYHRENYPRLRTVVTDWVRRHPDDLESRELLKQIQRVAPALDSAAGGDR